jgi:hypothetical protein
MFENGSRAKLKEIQKQVQENVKNMMSEQLQLSYSSRRHKSESSSRNRFMKPEFIASCSTFGPEVGIILSFHFLQSGNREPYIALHKTRQY